MPKIRAIHTDGRICLGHGGGGSSDERGEIVNSCLLLASQFFRRTGQKDEKADVLAHSSLAESPCVRVGVSSC